MLGSEKDTGRDIHGCWARRETQGVTYTDVGLGEKTQGVTYTDVGLGEKTQGVTYTDVGLGERHRA